MSYSHYRGKVYTNKEIKGPFTEAKDDFAEAYDLLQKKVGRRYNSEIRTLNLGDKIMILVDGIWLCISRDGTVEIGESGA